MKNTASFSFLAGCSLVAVAVLSSACHKNAPEPDTTTSLLVAHTWRPYSFADTDNTNTPPTTTYAAVSGARLDDTYQFNTDNELIFNDGTRRAVVTDPQVSTGSWQFQNTQANLSITLRRAVTLGTTGLSSTTIYDILKLSTDTLRLRTGTLAQTAVVTLVK
jgi:hypothetical protein